MNIFFVFVLLPSRSSNITEGITIIVRLVIEIDKKDLLKWNYLACDV